MGTLPKTNWIWKNCFSPPGRRSRHQPSNTRNLKAAAKGPTAATTSGAVALADGRVLHATASVKADRRAANAAVHGVKGMTKDRSTATGLAFGVMNRANAGNAPALPDLSSPNPRGKGRRIPGAPDQDDRPRVSAVRHRADDPAEAGAACGAFSIKKNAEGKPVQPLLLCALDDTLWLSEDEAVAHV